MKKREIFLLIILFIVIYAFIFVKFIWGGAIPDIEKVQAEIEKVKSEKAQLDEDYKNKGGAGMLEIIGALAVIYLIWYFIEHEK